MMKSREQQPGDDNHKPAEPGHCSMLEFGELQNQFGLDAFDIGLNAFDIGLGGDVVMDRVEPPGYPRKGRRQG
jgi:hypothetical protein